MVIVERAKASVPWDLACVPAVPLFSHLQTYFPTLRLLSLSLFCAFVGLLDLFTYSWVVEFSFLPSFQLPSKEAQLDTVIPTKRFIQEQLLGLWPVYGLTVLGSRANLWSIQLFLCGSLHRGIMGYVLSEHSNVWPIQTVMRTKKSLLEYTTEQVRRQGTFVSARKQ